MDGSTVVRTQSSLSQDCAPSGGVGPNPRPCAYFLCGHHLRSPSKRQWVFLVFVLKRATDSSGDCYLANRTGPQFLICNTEIQSSENGNFFHNLIGGKLDPILIPLAAKLDLFWHKGIYSL